MFYALALAIYRPASGADFIRAFVGGRNVISIRGIIVSGDGDKFEAITAALSPPGAVLLDSNGGTILESLRIGEDIRSKGFVTAVPNETVCASACGLIWLAGVRRYIGSTGRVGFHAAYVQDGAEAKETGVGNALVGAYLSKLGLSYTAVALVTSAHPSEIMWLNSSDAQKAGIDVVTLPDFEPNETSSREPIAAAPYRSPSSARQRLRDFVDRYFEFWSRSGSDVHGLENFYAETIKFYGSSTFRKKLIEIKRKFAERWPIRYYSVENGSITAHCASMCTVSGRVAWDTRSPARNAHSKGIAVFTFEIVPNDTDAGGVIIDENGSVLSVEKTVLGSPVSESRADANLP